MTNVLTVITNYKRPANIARIVDAVRKQTVQSTVVVVDNAPAGSPELIADVDDVWRFRENAGPPCRWAPALLDVKHKYVLFLDDDLVPGQAVIESCLRTAAMLGDVFATIGTIGRKYRRDGQSYRYVRRNVSRIDVPVAVDLTCRGHFVVTKNLWKAVKMRHDVLAVCGNQSLAMIHDDLFLCHGLQFNKDGAPSYVLPKVDGRESMCVENIPDDIGVSRIPSHNDDREMLINAMACLGWRSLA